jgi:hypothetical protein
VAGCGEAGVDSSLMVRHRGTGAGQQQGVISIFVELDGSISTEPKDAPPNTLDIRGSEGIVGLAGQLG